MSVAEEALIEGGELATAAVTLAHADDAFRGDDAMPLYRGEPVTARFHGLEIVDPAKVFADRAVRVFVSSTFGEFAAERDVIAKSVLPELQRRGSRRGVHVSSIDLRWGVTRAESAAGTAIERCLREVDAAYPFFVGLIGQNHGTRPSGELQRWSDEVKWLPAEAPDASITELEIRYAMLRPYRSNPSALIYYRARRRFPFQAKVPAIADEFRPLLSALRRRGYQPQAIGSKFAEHVTEKLWEVVRRHYPGASGPDTTLNDFRKHRQYGLQSASAIPTASDPVRVYTQAILGKQNGLIACKSSWEAAALAGALSIEVRKVTSALTFEHYPSLVDAGDSDHAFIARLAEFCRRTTKRVGSASPGTGSLELAGELAKLQAWAVTAKRQLLIVIGGSDLFGLEEDAILEGVRPHTNIHVIVTRTDTFGTKPGFAQAEWNRRDMAAFVETYLARHRKILDSEDASAVLAHPLANDLSYLRFVCDWLVTFARFETVSDALQQCLQTTTFSDLGGLLAAKGRMEMSDVHWRKFLQAILPDRHGRAEVDLKSQTGLRTTDVYAGLSVLSPILETWSGRVWRHHGQNWDALAAALLK